MGLHIAGVYPGTDLDPSLDGLIHVLYGGFYNILATIVNQNREILRLGNLGGVKVCVWVYQGL